MIEHDYNEDGFCVRCGISIVRACYAKIPCNVAENIVAITPRLASTVGTQTLKWIERDNAERRRNLMVLPGRASQDQ